jgi:ADP-ribose pyrophosphatase
MDLKEHLVRGEEVFAGRLLRVRRDVVRLPDGSESVREYIRHPGAVAVVALFDDDRVLLERQFRYPHGREFIELPAGKLEPGEPHAETARRELLEETGYVASSWTRIGLINPSIAYTDETIELYLARGLEKREAKLDAGEFLEVLTPSFDEVLAMLRDGRITDAKTVAGLLWVQAFAG